MEQDDTVECASLVFLSFSVSLPSAVLSSNTNWILDEPIYELCRLKTFSFEQAHDESRLGRPRSHLDSPEP